ncbi:MAG: hypothetical protein KAH54_04280 [Candidatus Sabulitectum sp.]|nr:hypothetical protein [Candidatus Sabulitectum sp.]
MKITAFLFLVVLAAGCGSQQPETDPAINISATDVIAEVAVAHLTSGIDLANQNVCRANLLTISASIAMYQAQNGELPATLGEVGSTICPEAGAYKYVVDGQNWTVSCPATPSHGSVESGASSW